MVAKNNISYDGVEQEKKWKKILATKDAEIDSFRRELDSIINLLNELHKQGVVMPLNF